MIMHDASIRTDLACLNKLANRIMLLQDTFTGKKNWHVQKQESIFANPAAQKLPENCMRRAWAHNVIITVMLAIIPTYVLSD